MTALTVFTVLRNLQESVGTAGLTSQIHGHCLTKNDILRVQKATVWWLTKGDGLEDG